MKTLQDYYEANDVVGRRFFGVVRFEGRNRKPVTRVYTVTRQLIHRVGVSFRYAGEVVETEFSTIYRNAKDKLYRQKQISLPASNPSLDEVDGPFTLVRD